jgi:4-diphosphocytidyl-2-C-methyl-D-erythritol kinase
MAKTELKTPAKINIGLYVTEKRQDGYHNIETIFYPVNIYDRLSFEDSDRFKYSSNAKSLPNDSTNLVIRAKNLLEEYTGEKLNIRIHLHKNIPIGAGLGGGSSDAAASLTGLNEFVGLNLTVNEISDLAQRLGSDVPFFLNPRPCFAGGRGDILHALLLKPELPIVLANPGVNISTKWAYKNIDPVKPNYHLSNLKSLDISHLKLCSDKILNVFEKPVFEKYPEIKAIKLLHYKLGAVFSLMSGTGSTVYGIYPDKAAAKSAGRVMKEKGYFVFVQEGGKSK